jgi:hypothetical protein
MNKPILLILCVIIALSGFAQKKFKKVTTNFTNPMMWIW